MRQRKIKIKQLKKNVQTNAIDTLYLKLNVSTVDHFESF